MNMRRLVAQLIGAYAVGDLHGAAEIAGAYCEARLRGELDPWHGDPYGFDADSLVRRVESWLDDSRQREVDSIVWDEHCN